MLMGNKDQTLCRYPTCRNERQVGTNAGRPGADCGNPDHNAVANHRARQYLRAIAATAQETQEVPSPGGEHIMPTGAAVDSLRGSVIARIT